MGYPIGCVSLAVRFSKFDNVWRTVKSGCKTPTTPSKLPNAESASGELIAKKHVHPTITIEHTPRKGPTSRVMTRIIRTSGAVAGKPRR